MVADDAAADGKLHFDEAAVAAAMSECGDPALLGGKDPGSEEAQRAWHTLDGVLRECHELLIEPIWDALAGETDLVIIPDGDLYSLPFAALKAGDGRHLIESHSVSIAPSIGTDSQKIDICC